VAFADAHGIRVTNRRTNRTRVLAQDTGFSLDWSPDSKAIAYVSGFMHFGTSRTGDLKVVTLGGKLRTIVSRDAPHGGEIVAVAWTRPPAKIRYRAPTPVDGIYAGGEVARLAADGSHIAFASCDSVYAWTPPAGEITTIDSNPLGDTLCFPPTDRLQVYDLAVAGDRVAYGRSYGGLTPPLDLKLSSISAPAPVVAAHSGTVVGGHQHGVGSLAGADGLLVYSAWDGTVAGTIFGDVIVTTQSIYRVESATCPCPAIASVPALGAPLDVDGGRVVVAHASWPDATWASRIPSLSILDRTGTEILSVPVDAAAAQLSGRDLVAAVGGSLVDFDAATGEQIHSWPVSSEPPARDCLFWAGPDCIGFLYAEPPHYVLQDVARGLAAYTLDGKLHLLRLADGKDTVAGYARLARFTDAGLAYADGSRIHVRPLTGRR
jgi:hypothetical protein